MSRGADRIGASGGRLFRTCLRLDLQPRRDSLSGRAGSRTRRRDRPRPPTRTSERCPARDFQRHRVHAGCTPPRPGHVTRPSYASRTATVSSTVLAALSSPATARIQLFPAHEELFEELVACSPVCGEHVHVFVQSSASVRSASSTRASVSCHVPFDESAPGRLLPGLARNGNGFAGDFRDGSGSGLEVGPPGR